jgi:hypothetical protein
MLKLNPDPEFTAPVNITVPGRDKPETITLTFKYRGKKELNDFWAGNKGREDADILMDIVTGWKGIDAEFNKENVVVFLNNYPAFAGELALAYSKYCLESRVKN